MVYSFKKVSRVEIIESACTGGFIGTLHVGDYQIIDLGEKLTTFKRSPL